MSRRSSTPPPPSVNVPAAHGYRVTGPIGAGAATLLEEALSPSGRPVALKRARRGVGPVGKVLQNEAEALGRLSHPNVITFFETIGPPHEPMLVLERLQGHSLAEVLEARVRFSPDVATRIAYDLAEALAHVHERGVVHGDLSTANVFITETGIVKLIDFGSARLMDTPAPAVASFATPGYVAPERLLGEPGDARGDLFSLGVVLYEMLTGHLPWDEAAEGVGRAARKLVPLGDRIRTVPRRLETLVHELLARNPADRPISAEVVAETLEPRAALLPPRALRAQLTGEPHVESEGTLQVRDLAARYGAVLLAFAVMAMILRVLLGEHVARAAGEGVVGADLAEVGRLRVSAKPWAEIWIDGQHVETTPFFEPLRLLPGAHTLTLKHPLAAPDEREILAEPGVEILIQKQFDIPKHPAKPHEPDDGPVRREKMQ